MIDLTESISRGQRTAKAICEVHHKPEQKTKIIWITLDHFGSPDLKENQHKLTQMGLLRNN